MKSLLFVIPSIGLALISFSCQHSGLSTLDYDKLNYDTNKIVIFKWDTAKYIFPDNSKPLPLTQKDLKIVDSLLTDAIDSFNIRISPELYGSFENRVPIENFIIEHDKYKYQYFPFKDVNGQRIIDIIGFSTDFQPWRTKVYLGRLHYGISKMELKVNLSETSREKLYTGDYG